MYWRTAIALLVTTGVFLLPAHGFEDDSPSKSSNEPTYSLRTSVIGAAGVPSQSTGFRQKGTLAQSTPIGICAESGNTLSAGFWQVWIGTVTGIEEETPVFADRLFQNYPNPFNPTTSIDFTVAKAGPVSITIYNIKGQRVRRLVDETKPPGRHTVTWDGTSERGGPVASGVYFYRIRIGAFTDVKKMVVLK